jgi:macrophage infectivity potentiator
MKKVIMLALLIAAGSALNTASAQSKKKDKKNKATTECSEACKTAPIVLKSAADSLSYATGMTMSNGLDAYLEQQFGITKELMPDFIRGLKEGISKRKDANFAAYGVGIAVSRQIESRLLPNMVSHFEELKSPIDTEILYSGIVAAMSKDSTTMSPATAAKFFKEQEIAIRQQREAENKAKNEAFMAENKAKEGVVTLPSGLQYRIIKKGTGAIPKATDDVQVIYEGKTIDGKVFDSTAKHGTEFDTFNVGGLIKGWTEALQLMPVGSKWEIFIPYNLAYGERGAGRDIAPYSTLIFTLELKDIDGVHEVKPSTVTPSKETVAKKAVKPAKKNTTKAGK